MNTRRVVLIGHPVAHSLSPAMHNAAFAHDRLAFRYEAWDVPAEDLGVGVGRIAAEDTAGANVTVPHKRAVVSYLDWCDETVKLAGAVNTVVNDHGRLLGYNTDVAGVANVLRAAGFDGQGDVLLLGAGGAARGAVVALARLGVARVHVMNRTRAHAEAMAQDLAGLGMEVMVHDLVAPAANQPWVRNLRLVLNATSVGLPGSGPYPFPDLLWVPDRAVVLDLVYHPGGTPLGLMPRPPGVRFVPGEEVLVAQGAESYRLWTGRPAPVMVMRTVVHDALRRAAAVHGILRGRAAARAGDGAVHRES